MIFGDTPRIRDGIAAEQGTNPDSRTDMLASHPLSKGGHVGKGSVATVISAAVATAIGKPTGINDVGGVVGATRRQSADDSGIVTHGLVGDVAIAIVPVVAAIYGEFGKARGRTETAAESGGKGERGLARMRFQDAHGGGRENSTAQMDAHRAALHIENQCDAAFVHAP